MPAFHSSVSNHGCCLVLILQMKAEDMNAGLEEQGQNSLQQNRRLRSTLYYQVHSFMVESLGGSGADREAGKQAGSGWPVLAAMYTDPQ